jgi:hypothetical protein
MKKLLCIYLLAGFSFIGRTEAAAPQKIDLSLTGQPRSYVISGTPYRALGFGKTLFGMKVDVVRQLLTSVYPDSVATMKDDTDLLTRNRSLTLVIPHLDPGPGPATMSYVFGARCECLVAVNMVWLITGTASPAQQAELVTAASQLAAGLVGHQWPAFSSVRGHVLDNNALVVFSGKDDGGGGVEIRLDGVALDVEPRATDAAPQRTQHRVPQPGPAQLRMSLVANADHPDVYRIPDNAF